MGDVLRRTEIINQAAESPVTSHHPSVYIGLRLFVDSIYSLRITSIANLLSVKHIYRQSSMVLLAVPNTNAQTDFNCFKSRYNLISLHRARSIQSLHFSR